MIDWIGKNFKVWYRLILILLKLIISMYDNRKCYCDDLWIYKMKIKLVMFYKDMEFKFIYYFIFWEWFYDKILKIKCIVDIVIDFINWLCFMVCIIDSLVFCLINWMYYMGVCCIIGG